MGIYNRDLHEDPAVHWNNPALQELRKNHPNLLEDLQTQEQYNDINGPFYETYKAELQKFLHNADRFLCGQQNKFAIITGYPRYRIDVKKQSQILSVGVRFAIFEGDSWKHISMHVYNYAKKRLTVIGGDAFRSHELPTRWLQKNMGKCEASK